MSGEESSRESLLHDVQFRFPFPCRVADDVEHAYARNLRWARSYGLIDEESLERYTAVDLVQLAAYAYPYARGADLDLAADLFAVWFIVDDQFDGPINQRPDLAARRCEEIISVFHRAEDASHASPIVRGVRRCVAP